MLVKLTISLPEDLRRRARAVAALRGEGLSEVVRAALERYIEESLEDAEDSRSAREIRERIASGQERTYTHDEIWAEIEALEAKGELPA